MTINSEVRTAGPFTGSGGTGPFTFAFEIFATSELLVQTKKISDGTIATLALITDYTVSLNANQNTSPGGTITLVANLSSAYTLTMTSAVQFKQATQLTNNGPFFAKTITTCLDRLTILAQQVKVTASRAIKFPIVDGTSLTTDIPAAAQRASKALIFDGSGNVTVSVDNYNDQLANVTAQAAAAQASADAAALDKTACDADVVLTHADVVTTGTNATTSTTQAGISTAQAVIATAQAVIATAKAVLTAADRVQTGLDVTSAGASASTATTQAGLAATAKTACDSDKTACDADAVATAADRVQTGLDRTQTGSDSTAAAASAAAAASSAAEGLYNDVVTKVFADSPIVPLLAEEGTLYRIDTSGGNVVINLSTLATYAEDMKFAFVKTTADANTVTVNRGGANTINGANSITLSTQYEVHVLVGDSATGTWVDCVQSTGIADGSVTLAKMANMATASVIYRKTAGTGVPEVQTLATLKTDLGLTGTNSGDQTLPVKATGAELDTGTDDAKFATAKALKDSHNVPSVVPGTSGNLLTSNGTDWTSAAPAGSSQLVLLSTATASTSASLAFASVITSSYDNYILVVKDLTFSTTGTLQFNSSTDNGANYTVTNETQVQKTTIGGTTAVSFTGTAYGTNNVLTSSSGSVVLNGEFLVTGALGAQGGMIGRLIFSGGSVAFTTFTDFAGAAVNAIQFKPSAGTFTSGKIYMYGVKNT